MKLYWIIALVVAGVIVVGLIIYILQPGAFLRTQVTGPARPAVPLPTSRDGCLVQQQECASLCRTSSDTTSSCAFQCKSGLETCLANLK